MELVRNSFCSDSRALLIGWWTRGSHEDCSRTKYAQNILNLWFCNWNGCYRFLNCSVWRDVQLFGKNMATIYHRKYGKLNQKTNVCGYINLFNVLEMFWCRFKEDSGGPAWESVRPSSCAWREVEQVDSNQQLGYQFFEFSALGWNIGYDGCYVGQKAC